MGGSTLAKKAKLRLCGKDPIGFYLRMNHWIWKWFPLSLNAVFPIRSYGNLLQTLVRMRATRGQNFGTLFFRNRPQLELIRRLSEQKKEGSILRICVLACSKGAEVYSVVWTIRSARPDLKVITHAVDISGEVLDFAQRGIYSLQNPELVAIPVFGRITEKEMEEMFDREGDRVRIKPWVKEGIAWHLGDAGDPEIADKVGPQDIVVANNFLCHMDSPDAERCLRNIAGLVIAGGYLFVSGIDLGVRTRVARDLGWKSIRDLMEEIHDGDSYLRVDWPWEYWGLEPLNKRRRDWKVRYASCFQLGKEI